jgi:hypothetical protein
MVIDLTEENGSEWKIDGIKEVFNGRDVENILAMPIMDKIGEDIQCWKFTTHGDYTVKSAYHYTIYSLRLSER